MAGPTDILTAIQNGVIALNELGQQVKGSFLNISSQLTTLQANPYKIAALSRVLSVASGNVSYTGVGFTPRLILFQTGISGGGGWASQGQATAIDNRCLEIAINAGGTNSILYQGTFAGLQRDDIAGANFQTFTVFSLDADGFTLAWTKVGTPTATANITATCFR